MIWNHFRIIIRIRNHFLGLTQCCLPDTLYKIPFASVYDVRFSSLNVIDETVRLLKLLGAICRADIRFDDAVIDLTTTTTGFSSASSSK
jgi:hypothetical protein